MTAARAVRAQAQDLALASRRLRLTVGARRSETVLRRLAAEEASRRLRRARGRGVASPWSGLLWRPAAADLDHVLDSVPGDPGSGSRDSPSG